MTNPHDPDSPGPDSPAPDSHGQSRSWVATAADSGARLDKFLADALPDLSRTRLKRLIEEGRVTENGRTITDPSYRVKPSWKFAVYIPEAAPAVPLAQALPLDIVYEDDDLLVVDKPAGLVVHPAPGNPDRTLVNALIAHCGDSLSGIGGQRRPGIVHRLDKDTSGLLVVAKNDAAHHALARQFAARSVDRAYLALVWGRLKPAAGSIRGNIGRNPSNRKKMAVLSRGGRSALTHYRTMQPVGSAASLLECRLETGRTHQIRVHLAAKGHPVIGDSTYGGGAKTGTRAGKPFGVAAAAALESFGRHALQAVLLGFEHPSFKKRLRFEIKLHNDIKALTNILEKF